MNTPSMAEQKILSSQCYTGGEWFTTITLTKETSMEKDYLNGVLRDMVEGKVLIVNHNMGRAAYYKQPNKSLYAFIRGPWRRHTNEQLGLERHYLWAIL